MTLLFIILILLASVILSLIVLVQNPKGGGLAGNIGGFSNQFMGVKQTNDVLEKGTWIFAAIIGVLCIVSTMFISGGTTATQDKIQNVSTGPLPTQQAPANQNNTVPLNAPGNQPANQPANQPNAPQK
jgi:preprotein translocase subunit SecG